MTRCRAGDAPRAHRPISVKTSSTTTSTRAARPPTPVGSARWPRKMPISGRAGLSHPWKSRGQTTTGSVRLRTDHDPQAKHSRARLDPFRLDASPEPRPPYTRGLMAKHATAALMSQAHSSRARHFSALPGARRRTVTPAPRCRRSSVRRPVGDRRPPRELAEAAVQRRDALAESSIDPHPPQSSARVQPDTSSSRNLIATFSAIGRVVTSAPIWHLLICRNPCRPDVQSLGHRGFHLSGRR